jgi:hypothetical protein
MHPQEIFAQELGEMYAVIRQKYVALGFEKEINRQVTIPKSIILLMLGTLSLSPPYIHVYLHC